MISQVEVCLKPAELERLQASHLDGTTCVVFDVLRATSTMAAALHHGAKEIVVVGEIEEALALRGQNQQLLLAGERGGQRISAALTGSIDFDLGNSPREFCRDTVAGRSIVMTTTNGTRALQACDGAASVLAASFLNLKATARAIEDSPTQRIIVVCAGTGDAASYEDTLGAGALLALLPEAQFNISTDACLMARQLYQSVSDNLEAAFGRSVNGMRLAADIELRADLAFCAQRDIVPKPVRVVGNIARV